MNNRERVIAQIFHQETDFIPYRLAFENETVMYQLDDFFGGDQWRKKLDNHIIYLEQPHPGLAIPQPDPNYQGLWRDCFGGMWDITKQPPHIVEPPLSEPNLSHYNFPDPQNCISEGWIEKSQSLITQNPMYFSVARLGFGIFERSWAMRGFDNALMDSALNGVFYQDLLTNIFQFQTSLLGFILEKLPIDGILFADDWGYQDGILLGAKRWRQYFKPLYERLYAKTHHSGKFTLNHVCGSVREIMPELIEIGLNVLESVQPEAKGMNPYQLKENFGKDIAFFGGLGSQSIIQFGSPAEIQAEVAKLTQKMGKGGGYILAPSKPIQPGTPFENVAAVLESFVNQQ